MHRLEYQNGSRDIKRHVDEEDKTDGVAICDSIGREQNGEPWFVGKDVAEALGYKNPQEAIRTHIDDEDKGVSEIRTPGGKQNAPIINESGLYSLVLSSKLPKRQF